MKKVLLIFVITALIFSCKNEKNGKENEAVKTEQAALHDTDVAANYQKAEFTIEGMTCAIGCAATIQKNLAGLDGVKEANVNFDTKLATVEYNEAKLSFDDLAKTVTSTGNGDTYTVVTNTGKTEKHSAGCAKECCKGKTKAQKKNCGKDGCKKPCCSKKA
ncbi:heavy-metal-associated domain-containing protein [Abyssalbus ytuae]|uniref:Cation transporter n=1 Tax=Abyssalbus ytuae TaxID=2926907 RepID=A0A9E6ZKH5_9FLAO|nr:heavy metal-associated domain-containing protein [Abyssalbus ytuae]UOB16234.1 cation transporter [Abyssalbus ytuae]